MALGDNGGDMGDKEVIWAIMEVIWAIMEVIWAIMEVILAFYRDNLNRSENMKQK